jgi:hypothetical protein
LGLPVARAKRTSSTKPMKLYTIKIQNRVVKNHRLLCHGHRIYFLRSNTKSTEQIKARIYHWQKSKRIARILKKTRINTGKTGVVVV